MKHSALPDGTLNVLKSISGLRWEPRQQNVAWNLNRDLIKYLYLTVVTSHLAGWPPVHSGTAWVWIQHVCLVIGLYRTTYRVKSISIINWGNQNLAGQFQDLLYLKDHLRPIFQTLKADFLSFKFLAYKPIVQWSQCSDVTLVSTHWAGRWSGDTYLNNYLNSPPQPPSVHLLHTADCAALAADMASIKILPTYSRFISLDRK